MYTRFPLIVLLLALNCACVSYPPDTPPPGYSQSSPKQTIYYLQWAYENQNPLHVSKCLSFDFMTGANMDPSDLALWWDEAKETVEEYIGNVDDIEVVDELFESNDGKVKILQLTSNKRDAKVTFVLESRYLIIPTKATQDVAENEFPSMKEVVTFDQDTAVIRLPKVPNAEQYPAEMIHRIIIESAWRIDRIETSDMVPLGNKRRM
ncbi:MAG: hypothetical protein ACI97A_001142 [Planctomycetota bacterium]|jgi:hypothetical protein